MRALVVLVIAACGPAALVAQSRWERQVDDRLRRALNTVQPHDAAAPPVTKSGMLNEEESASFVVTLVGGVSYAILGVCDDDCVRLQLVLATPTNNDLALERNSESFPILQFTPTETTRYRIRVVMDRCRMNPCWYAVGIASQRSPKRS